MDTLNMLQIFCDILILQFLV